MLTRRGLLLKAGAAGGTAAVFSLATALGIVPASPAGARINLTGRGSSDKPVHVAILGGGLAGLSAAYELTRAGYRVTILEASHRLGGRNLTLRHGTLIDEVGNPRVCDFDGRPDLFFNCGPARIPGTHRRVLNYCRELGVALHPFINENLNAYIQADGFNDAKPMRQRRYYSESRGFIAELGAKSAKAGILEAPVDTADVEKLVEFFRAYGNLNEEGDFAGSLRGGVTNGGILHPPKVHDPDLPIAELLKTPFWEFPMHFTEGSDGHGDQFAGMMEPVGGMDKIVDAFARHVSRYATLHAMVTGIWMTEDGVAIDYRHGGAEKRLEADYCLNAIPGHLLNGIANNLPQDFRALVQDMGSADGTGGFHLSKIGLQMKRRFWEDDGIYGGASWAADDLLQIWYPSHGFHSDKGVLLGGYVFDLNDNPANAKLAALTPAARIEAALAMGEKVHGQAYRDNFETGVSVIWHRMNHLLGCGGGFAGHDSEKKIVAAQKPVMGRHWLIGDQVTFLTGWQEGAFAASEQAVQALDRMAVQAHA